MKGVQQILTFVDDIGEPMNEDASQFLVMVPVALWDAAQAAVNSKDQFASQTTLEKLTDFTIRAVPNVRMDTAASAWTDKFVVFRTDSDVKPLIRQQETPIVIKAIAEGSELEFKDDKHWYGIDTWRNVDYGYWQDACLVTMT